MEDRTNISFEQNSSFIKKNNSEYSENLFSDINHSCSSDNSEV